MRNNNRHSDRCDKQTLSKCEGVCKTYSPLQAAYAKKLQNDDTVESFLCNQPIEIEGDYTTDFVIRRLDGSVTIRECIEIDDLMKLKNAKLMDQSRCYWLKRGITDWGIVTSAEE